MLYMSQANISRRARRWAWAHRPSNSLDNPVKRYLGNGAVGHGLWQRQSRNGMGRLTMRPAT
jgi:hypothetical protein